jgi:hypothetical protein
MIKMLRKLIRWIARIMLLTLSYFGFLTVYTYYHRDYLIDGNTLQIAWVYGIGGLLLFGLSFVNFKRGKKNERI